MLSTTSAASLLNVRRDRRRGRALVLRRRSDCPRRAARRPRARRADRQLLYLDDGDVTGGDKLSDTDSATYTIVPVPNTAPTVTVSGVADGESYDKDDVPVAMCEVVDAEDGNPSFEAELSAITGPYSSDGIGEQTATCEHTDSGNIIGEDMLSDDAAATYSIVDPTAPAI